ncbi:SIMPL domain-containing protein [Pseudotabrizicola sp. L79]|uniref:SIMPL domain-containing protein n=1 Tax=Pseudotabrizicola sp. L79 TaxID=3118402 RepID=UPI002F9448F2
MSVFKAIVLSLPLLAPLSMPTWAETAATITVSGEGSVEGAPDMAVLSLGVTTEGATATEAMSANSAALTAVLERLKAAGIADRDLQTSNLSLNPNWTGYDSGATPKIVGYTASNQLMVRIRDLPKLGEVLDAAITDGANTLNGISFGLSNPRPAMDEARTEAVADARARAELLVTAAGARLGKIVSINENGGYAQPAPMFRAAAEAAPVPVQGGEVATTATVTIVFEIVQ